MKLLPLNIIVLLFYFFEVQEIKNNIAGMYEDSTSLFKELILSQKPMDGLSYMGSYNKRILNIYTCKEENFIKIEWPMLWRMIQAINKKISPISYTDMATLNMKSNGHMDIDEVIVAMQPKKCIVWGIEPMGKYAQNSTYEVIVDGEMEIVFAEKLEVYEDSDAKKKIWGVFTQLFKQS